MLGCPDHVSAALATLWQKTIVGAAGLLVCWPAGLLVTIAQIFGFSIFAPECAWILAQHLILLAAVWRIGNKILANRT